MQLGALGLKNGDEPCAEACHSNQNTVTHLRKDRMVGAAGRVQEENFKKIYRTHS